MLPITRVPETIAKVMEKFRKVFCRDEGFEHVSRYLTGLILSPNKTLQGIYDLQVWEGEVPSRRAMHEAIFEAGWESEELIKQHRCEVAKDYQAEGRKVISVDWTLSHHERGPEIYGVTKAYDYVAGRTARFQTLITAVVSNRELIDGLEIIAQDPKDLKAEAAYLKATAKENYESMAEVEQRLLELLHYRKHELEYRKRTEIALEIVRQIESEGEFPEADYAFDNGVLTLGLTRFIEGCDKHWVSELESSRHINWKGQWGRVDGVELELRTQHPESFRPLKVRLRNGEEKEFWVFSKVVRLKRYGRKRIVIVHERADLSERPRFLVTDALHWESKRVVQTWSYRWSSEVFHEFGKQVTGLESAQVRKEEAVTRHFRLSCVAQSLIQRAPAVASKSERFEFAEGKITYGQKCRVIAREVLRSMLELSKRYFAEGKSSEEVLELLMPA
jgi:DDE superfamily endonuclease